MSSISSNRPGVIALVDWTWSGHHPTYFNHLVMAFEELGVNVLALCPEPEAAAQTAAQVRPASPSGRGWTAFKKISLPPQRLGRFRHTRLVGTLSSVRHFKSIENQIHAWSRASGKPVSAIFYACIYDWDFHWIRLVRPFLRLPWMGLYVNATTYRMPGRINSRTRKVPRPEKTFGGRLCRGIAILDEGIVDRVAASIGKPVVVFPDPTDERLALSPEDSAPGERLKKFAAGRPIVGLLGHLHESKGVATFLEAIRMIPPSEICFALAGEVYGNQSSSLARQIQLAVAEQSNLWHHLHRIPNESCFNHLLAACDVICAVYWDFPHSSGIQTKAAVFKKPLIVSDGYLMAERTRLYHLGEVIPQKNAPALRDAIFKLTNPPGTWVAEHQPRWLDYHRIHAFDGLKAGLKKLLNAH